MHRKFLKTAAVILTGAFLLSSCSIGGKKYKGYLEIPDDVPSSYTIFEDSVPKRIDNQVGGTCWASSATTVMEYG